MAIDLYTDPINVRRGIWTWMENGPYFGIPIGNFIGWFLVTTISTGLFRCYEHYRPIKLRIKNINIFMLPIVYYALMWVYHTYFALHFQMINLVFLGSLVTLQTIIINLILFTKLRMQAKLVLNSSQKT